MTAANLDLAPALWSALKDAPAPASIAELMRRTPGRHHHVAARLDGWERIGLVEAAPAVPVRFAIASAHRDRKQAPSEGLLSANAWAVLRRFGSPATLAEIAAAAGSSDRGAYCRLFRWLQTGHVVRIDREPQRFVLTSEARDIAEPPKVPVTRVRKLRNSRPRIWAAMRVLKTFDIPTLVMAAEAGRRPIENFISVLGRAGYLRPVEHRVTRVKPGAHGFARDYSFYRLVRSTGPKCPIEQWPPKEPGLFDPNTGTLSPLVARQRRGVNHVR